MRLLSHTLLKFGNLSKEIDDLMVRRSFSKQQGQSDPGIVIDSDPAGEYRECLLKAEFLTRGEVNGR